MEDYCRAEHERAGYEFVFTPHIAKADAVRDQRPPRLLRRRHVPADGARRGRTVLPEADELPDAHADLPGRGSGPTASCRCGCSSSARCTATSSRASCTACCGPGASPRTTRHIFCTPEQLGDELASLLAFVLRLLRDFGFEDFEAELSTRPGEVRRRRPTDWDEAERGAARRASRRPDLPYVVDEGEGAFYAPEDRRPRPRRHRPALAAVHHPGRLPVPRPLRPRVRRRRQPAPPAPA